MIDCNGCDPDAMYHFTSCPLSGQLRGTLYLRTDEPTYDYVERGTVERLRAELAATQVAATEMHTKLLRMAPFAALSGYTSTIATGDPATRGAAILAAAHEVADTATALLVHFERHTDHRCEIDRDAASALDAWRALNVGGREP